MRLQEKRKALTRATRFESAVAAKGWLQTGGVMRATAAVVVAGWWRHASVTPSPAAQRPGSGIAEGGGHGV